MKKNVLLLCGLSAALTLTGCGVNDAKIRIGAAGIGGTYQAFASSLAQLASETGMEQEFEVKTTAGSAANLRLLSQDYIQLGLAQADLVNDAYYSTGTFEDSGYQGYSAVAGLYTEACQIVVLADSDIYEINDLLDKTVSVGEEESGTEQNASQILEVYGLSDALVDKVNLNYTDAASSLKNGEIDAFFCTAGIQTTVIEELAGQCSLRFLSIEGESLEKLEALSDFYTAYVIPAGTYTGQDEDVSTVGIKSVLLASDKLSADTVQNLTALLFEQQEEIQYSVPVDYQPDEEYATSNITIPFHPGAAAYYADKGIQVSTGDEESK